MWSEAEFEVDVGEEIEFAIADGQSVEFSEDEYIEAEFEVDVGEEIEFAIADGQSVEFSEDEYIAVVGTDAPTYDGPYEAVPTQVAQAFSTGGKVMASDFTVAPIPSNYGLIEWDGSVLRVS